MSLSERLRQAALERARDSGHQVDDFVLEPTGVIDLREMERQPAPSVDNTIELPALETEAVVDDLYGKPLSEIRLWKRVRGTMVPGETAAAETEPAEPAERTDTIDLTDAVPLIDLAAPVTDTGLDPDLAAQPTLPCQRCGGTAPRDLINIFNNLEYYSCNDCGHMWQQKKA